MIFLDSWVWLELFFQGDHADIAADAIREIDTEGGVISPTVLLEVTYRAQRETSADRAGHVAETIRRIERLSITPLDAPLAVRAAELRDKYYQRRELELSYTDAVHIAMAEDIGCERLYSGDLGFDDIDEVDTVVVR